MKPHKVLEKLDRNGYAPCLINNDDGKWAVSCDAMQPMFPDHLEMPEEIDLIVWCKTKYFKKSIKKAVRAFLKYEEINLDNLEEK